jgi:putative Mn2+ efflux pump MntP
VLRLLALLLPLGLDTFAVAAALGVAGLTRPQRVRASLVLAAFEAGMPLIGVGVGQALGHAVGSLADYVAGIALIMLGSYLVFAGDDDDAGRTSALARTRGLAIIGLGISISLDELAVGFSVGLLRVPIIWAILLIAVQALVVAQMGMRLGSRIRERFRERIEKVSGLALAALGALFLALRIAG